jgi:hypothetical protein
MRAWAGVPERLPSHGHAVGLTGTNSRMRLQSDPFGCGAKQRAVAGQACTDPRGGAEGVFDAVRFHDDGHASVKLIVKARAYCYLAKSVRSVDSKAIVRS